MPKFDKFNIYKYRLFKRLEYLNLYKSLAKIDQKMLDQFLDTYKFQINSDGQEYDKCLSQLVGGDLKSGGSDRYGGVRTVTDLDNMQKNYWLKSEFYTHLKNAEEVLAHRSEMSSKKLLPNLLPPVGNLTCCFCSRSIEGAHEVPDNNPYDSYPLHECEKCYDILDWGKGFNDELEFDDQGHLRVAPECILAMYNGMIICAFCERKLKMHDKTNKSIDQKTEMLKELMYSSSL